jgi:hypothetical protein
MKINLLASSPTKEGIIQAINKFYYSTSFEVDFNTGEVRNKFKVITYVRVVFIKGRYRFESLPVENQVNELTKTGYKIAIK